MDSAQEKIDKVKGTTLELARLYARQMKLLHELALAVEHKEGLTPEHALNDSYVVEITISLEVKAKTSLKASEKVKSDPRFVGMFEQHNATLIIRRGFVRR